MIERDNINALTGLGPGVTISLSSNMKPNIDTHSTVLVKEKCEFESIIVQPVARYVVIDVSKENESLLLFIVGEGHKSL